MNPSDIISIASLVVALVSIVIANGARKDAERIAENAHDEWAQQKWFDLYFKVNYAYDTWDKLQADSIVQKNGTINIHGGNYPDRANEVIRLFREIQAMAMVFPRCTVIDTLCAATSGICHRLPGRCFANSALKNITRTR